MQTRNGPADVPQPLDSATAVEVSEAVSAAVTERRPPAATVSRYGPLGALAKRILQRLIRFYTTRQDSVNAELAARLSAIETMLGDVPDLRRDITEAALDFGAIADRLTAFENVRRIVDRSSAYRNEVRVHRRDLLGLHQQLGALSTRLTLVQRETAQTRTSVREIREDMATLGKSTELLASAAIGRDERLAELARSVGELRLAAARDFEKLSGTLRNELEDQIERARSSAWKLQTTVEALGREVSAAAAMGQRLAGAEQRLEGSEEFGDRIAALERRHADFAGAMNQVREQMIDAIRAEIRVTAAEPSVQQSDGSVAAADRALAADVETLRQGVAALAAQLDELRNRLLATPYMSAPMTDWPLRRISTPDDFDYVGFEDVFRGPEELIRERLQRYVILVIDRAPVVELGAGRGEFMEVMREHGIPAAGVDLNADAVARCRAKGIDNVVLGDANEYLAALEERSAGAVFSAQFVEHVSFEYLLRFLELARTRLTPGGIFIAETVNPNSIEGWKTFFVDLSHVKPLFPEVFAFLCRSMGFVDVRIFYSNGEGFDESTPGSQHEYAVVATAP